MAQSESPFPTEILSEFGFLARTSRSRPNSYEARGSASRTAVRTSLNWHIEYLIDRNRNDIDTFEPAGRYRGYEDKLPSAVPVGCDVKFLCKEGRLSLVTTGRFEYCLVQLLLQGSDAKGFYKAPEHDWTEDIKLVERLARVTMARAAGLRLGGLGTVSFPGYQALGSTCSKTARKYVGLSAWATTKGWSVEKNEDLAYWTLRKGANSIVVPAGANKIKVNGTWRVLPDLVMEKGGYRLVPEADFRNLP